MNQPTIDALARSLSPHASRRGAVRAVGVLGLASLLDRSDAQAKRKKKKKCPKARKGFCAGKNYCSQPEPVPACNKPGTPACLCWLRSDPEHIGESVCGSTIQQIVPSCSACPDDQMCVVLGGVCGSSGFACVTTCPDPL